jgi:hypothetical protein
MGIRRGEISTPIVADGLVFNMDAANRASTIPVSDTVISYNTVNLSQYGTFSDNGIFDSSTISPSFAFDGSDDEISLTPTITNNIYTLDFWYKMSDNDGGYGYFASSGANGLAISEGGTVSGLVYGQFYYYNGSIPNTLSNIPSTTNWNHICVIINTSRNNIKLYGNSIKLTDTTVTSMSTTISEIGRFNNSAHYLYGNLASFKIYNRALSSNEVLQNYNALKGRFGLLNLDQ